MELSSHGATTDPTKTNARGNHVKTLIVVAAILSASGLTARSAGSGTGAAAPKLVQRDASWVIDPNDKVALVEWADEVFIGSVEAQGDTDTSDPRLPQTHYTVTVDEVIFGETPAEVEVVQDGGVTEDGEELLLFAGDELYQLGTTRLFAAKVIDGERHVFPVLGSEELETQQEENVITDEYSEAVEEASTS